MLKKEVQNAKTNNPEYKQGDGFIRVGTSTRKMERDDYEQIYNNRIHRKDRKSNLIITPFIKVCSNTILRDKGYQCVDFKIENISNSSIKFDIQCHFFNNEDLCFYKKFDLDKQVIEESKKKFSSSFRIDFTPMMDLTLLDLSFRRTEASLLVSRIKRINQSATVEIAQNDYEESIFLNEVLVFKRNEVPILVELILRSDDFIDGALIKRFELN